VRRFTFAVAGVATAVVAVGLWAVPAGATPLLTVTPNTGLLDGQSVSVSASGYTPGAGLAVLECTTGASSESDCDLSTVAYVNADASGAVSTTYGVFRVIFTANDGAGVDCAPSQCVLVVANIGDQTEAASAALGFDASVPPPPTLQVSAIIDPTGTFDKAGNVTVTGTVDCNMPADVFADVTATQRAGRALFHAEGFGDIACDGPTHFAISLEPYDGIFRGGSAAVTLNYNSFSGSRNIFGSVQQTVQLRGGAK